MLSDCERIERTAQRGDAPHSLLKREVNAKEIIDVVGPRSSKYSGAVWVRRGVAFLKQERGALFDA